MLRIQNGNGPQKEVGTSCLEHVAKNSTLCVDLSSGGHWYGHGFNHDQPYPLESGNIINTQFAVNNIQSPIWMCSGGYTVLAHTTTALDVRINENGNGLLAIRAQESFPLHIFRGRNLPDARRMLVQHLGGPNQPPAPSLLGDSLFCTWTQYPRCITQERILSMAQQIREHDYPCTTLIIDDRWESCFGELTFSGDFPDPREMVAQLHALDFKVWLWVTPFVNKEATTFEALSARRHLVPHKSGEGTAMMRWWGGTAGLVDLTNPAGNKWYREQLLRLHDGIGVDGFKIDGGDFKYQPGPDIAAWHSPQGASGYADLLLSLFEEIVPNQCETRTAWLSQKRNVIWREGGKDSHWGTDNGLKALVSLGLHLGLMGYDILIPDMIPGRVQTMKSDMALPSDELLIRWTEATAFMPIMQFSYFPWNYAGETERCVRAYARLHKELQACISELANRRQAPLIRPIWYDNPDALDLYAVADEFMLGPNILVAPVLDAGITCRNVILPAGNWVDAWTGNLHRGGPITAHPAPCPGIPVFVRKEHGDIARLISEKLTDITRGSTPPGTTASYAAGLDRDLTVTG